MLKLQILVLELYNQLQCLTSRMSTIQFSCKVSTTDAHAGLGFEAWVDGDKFLDIDHVVESQQVVIDIDDDSAEHVLRLVMKNKTLADTKINQAGEIVQDARLIIENIAFDDLKLGYIFTKLAKYTHDFNGTGIETQENFYSEMGCNGTVCLEFNTPVYLWLLEHM